ncbi:MAG: LacI family DNA-binding transcriptional regulator [Propionicimonas sp.]
MPASLPGPAGASIFDVARRAGVSRATAARALGGYGSVSDEARTKVELAAQQLGYSVNTVARSMVTGQTMTLGALIADVSNPFFARVIRGFTDGVRKDGYNVLLVNTDESIDAEIHGLKVLMEKRVDGILLAPASIDSYDHLAAALNQGHAIVQLDRFVPELDADAVVVDNYDATYRAVQHVIEAGHTRIAAPVFRTTSDQGQANLISTMEERHRAYRDALAAAGLAAGPGYCPSVRGRQEVATAVRELLADPDRPTALFGLDDSFTMGIVDAAYASGLAIPQQVSIFGFDDTEWTTVVRPPLSVIAQPAYELGSCAAQLLLRRMRTPDAPRQTRVLPTTWIERDSVCRLGAAAQ